MSERYKIEYSGLEVDENKLPYIKIGHWTSYIQVYITDMKNDKRLQLEEFIKQLNNNKE